MEEFQEGALIGPMYTGVIGVKIPPDLPQDSITFFKALGCIVQPQCDHTHIIFPVGTTKQEIFPRLRWTESYRITLPNGIKLTQRYSIIGEISDITYLPEEIANCEGTLNG